MAGYRVKYTLATRLVNELVEAADEMILSKTIARYGRVDLLLIDELGYILPTPRPMPCPPRPSDARVHPHNRPPSLGRDVRIHPRSHRPVPPAPWVRLIMAHADTSRRTCVLAGVLSGYGRAVGVKCGREGPA
jgi:hypothetical protein